jgi:putative flavoprotein involved in K+ transport
VPASLAAADSFAAGIRRAIDEYARKLGLPDGQSDGWLAPPAPAAAASRRRAGPAVRRDHQPGLGVRLPAGLRLDPPPILGEHGFPEHRRGVTSLPGLYVLGLPWLHKWKSATLLGADEDAQFIAEQITR